MVKLFDSNFVNNTKQVVTSNTNYVSDDMQLNLVQGEITKSLKSVNNVVSSLSNNICMTGLTSSSNSFTVPASGTIILNNIGVDSYGLYDITTGIFKSPINGVLNFTIGINVLTPSIGVSLYLMKNPNSQATLSSLINNPTISTLIYNNPSTVTNSIINVSWYCIANRGDVILFYNGGSSFSTSYNNAQITMKW